MQAFIHKTFITDSRTPRPEKRTVVLRRPGPCWVALDVTFFQKTSQPKATRVGIVGCLQAERCTSNTTTRSKGYHDGFAFGGTKSIALSKSQVPDDQSFEKCFLDFRMTFGWSAVILNTYDRGGGVRGCCQEHARLRECGTKGSSLPFRAGRY